jgi:hypothetical protein
VRTLIDEFATSIIAPALKKRLFSAPYIPFPRYLGCYQVAFETGSVLGHVFRDKLATLVKLFCEPGREETLIIAMRELAQQKRARVEDCQNFAAFAMFDEEKRIIANWSESGITETQREHETRRLKITLEQGYKNICGAVTTGIGFGSAFPELTEQLWRAAYERTFTREEWQEYRRSGVVSGDEIPEPFPLAKRQEQILSLVELFVSTSRPELLSYFKFAGAGL